MSNAAIFWPMFALVLLTAMVLVRLFRSRVRAVRSGSVTTAYFRAFQGGVEPEASVVLARHFTNLFEAPTLFYVACITAMALHAVSPATVVLAWLYVLARAAHSIVHLGRNRLKYRIRAYFTSWLILLALWIELAVRIATGTA
jgi:hypothetical protein